MRTITLPLLLTALGALVTSTMVTDPEPAAPPTTGSAGVGEPEAGEERSVEIAPGVQMVFCYAPAGMVQLGSPKAERDAVFKVVKASVEPDWLAAEAEEKRGTFKTTGFWLGKYPVTQAEWKAVAGDNPSHFNGARDNRAKGADTARFPVDNVSWNACLAWLRKVNGRGGAEKVFGAAGAFRLPHEDEWEYACRGGRGNERAFYWGNEFNGAQANCDGNYPFGTDVKGAFLERPCAVDETGRGRFERHPWGLMHMHGNVHQWCSNTTAPFSCRSMYLIGRRCLRGGSWNCTAWDCRAAYRSWVDPDYGSHDFGFRVCFRAGDIE